MSEESMFEPPHDGVPEQVFVLVYGFEVESGPVGAVNVGKLNFFQFSIFKIEFFKLYQGRYKVGFRFKQPLSRRLKKLLQMELSNYEHLADDQKKAIDIARHVADQVRRDEGDGDKDFAEIARTVIAAHTTVQPPSSQEKSSSPPPDKPKKKSSQRKSCSREVHERKLKDCVIDFVNQSTQGITVKLGELTKAHNLRPEVFRTGTKGYKLMRAALKAVAKDRKGDKDAAQDFVIKLLEKTQK